MNTKSFAKISLFLAVFSFLVLPVAPVKAQAVDQTSLDTLKAQLIEILLQQVAVLQAKIDELIAKQEATDAKVEKVTQTATPVLGSSDPIPSGPSQEDIEEQRQIMEDWREENVAKLTATTEGWGIDDDTGLPAGTTFVIKVRVDNYHGKIPFSNVSYDLDISPSLPNSSITVETIGGAGSGGWDHDEPLDEGETGLYEIRVDFPTNSGEYTYSLSDFRVVGTEGEESTLPTISGELDTATRSGNSGPFQNSPSCIDSRLTYMGCL